MIRILHHLGSGSTCYARTALDGVEPSPLVCLRQSSSDLYLDDAVDADGSGDHDDGDVDDNDNDENDDDGDDGDDGDDDDDGDGHGVCGGGGGVGHAAAGGRRW